MKKEFLEKKKRISKKVIQQILETEKHFNKKFILKFIFFFRDKNKLKKKEKN